MKRNKSRAPAVRGLLCVLVLVAMCITLLPTKAFAATAITVNANGNVQVFDAWTDATKWATDNAPNGTVTIDLNADVDVPLVPTNVGASLLQNMNVTINLNGHTLSNDGKAYNSATIFFDGDPNNTGNTHSFRLVGPGTLRGGYTGALAQRASSVSVEGVTVTGAEVYGIQVLGADISITNCNVSNCSFGQSGGMAGIFARATNTLTVDNCDASGNKGVGIQVQNASDKTSTVSNCHANNQTGSGIACTGGAVNIVGCEIANNSSGGVTISDSVTSGTSLIDTCVISGNGAAGISMSNGAAARLVVQGGTQIKDNGASGVRLSFQAGTTISPEPLAFGPGGCTISGNKSITDTIGSGIYIISNPLAATTTLTLNLAGVTLTGNTGSAACYINSVKDPVTVNVTDSTVISDNAAGGLHVNKSFSTINITGGRITNNSGPASNLVLAGVMVSPDSAINLSGNPVITGNTRNGTTCNVYGMSNNIITLAGNLGDAADVGVTVPNNMTIGAQFGLAANGTQYSGLNRIKSDVPDNLVASETADGKLVWKLAAVNVTYADANTNQDNANPPTDAAASIEGGTQIKVQLGGGTWETSAVTGTLATYTEDQTFTPTGDINLKNDPTLAGNVFMGWTYDDANKAFTAVWEADAVGGGADGSTPDGIPDKYQALVTCTVVNGTFTGGATTTTAYVTLVDPNDNTKYSQSGSAQASLPLVTDIVPTTGYTTENCAWVPGDATVIAGGQTFTFTCEKLLDVSIDGANLDTTNVPTQAVGNKQFDTTLVPETGYVLPQEIVVTVGGTELPATDYTYDPTTGALTIPADKVTGDIAVKADCDVDAKGDANDPENKGDGVADRYQSKVTYTVTNGKLPDGSTTKTEYVTLKDTTGALSETGTATVTPPAVTADSGYVSNSTDWTPTDLTVTAAGKDFTFDCDVDAKGDANDPENKGDGVADKFQVKVTYTVTHGDMAGATTKTEYLTKMDGAVPSVSGKASVSFPAVTAVVGYTIDGVNWAPADTEITADTDYTFDCAKLLDVSISGSHLDTNGMPIYQGTRVEFDVTLKPEANYALEDQIFVSVGGVELPEEDYAYDPISGVLIIPADKVTGNIVVIADCDEDSKGDPANPDAKGDGVPDKYQIRVEFKATNGKIDGAASKIVYLTRFDELGMYSTTAPANVVFPTVVANSGYTTSGANWTPEYTTVNEPLTFTFACVQLGEKVNVTITAGPNGTSNPTGTVQVNKNDTLTITPTPNPGYVTDTVTVDGDKVAPNPDGTYTTPVITTATTVDITFAEDKLGGGPDGSQPDGIPDKYQKKITFTVSNGTWDGTDSANKTAYVTLYDEQGVYDVNGTGDITSILPDVTNAAPGIGYTSTGASWDPANVLVTGTEAATVTYKFPVDPGAAVTPVWKFDYNHNGTVDSADILAMRKLMANVMTPTGDQLAFFCVLFDVNNNGVVDSADILSARKQMANVDPMYQVNMPDAYMGYYPA